MQLITFDKEKCLSCYACVKACPVKAITISSSDDILSFNHNRCLGCGNCYVSCGPKAIGYIDSTEAVTKLLNSETPCIAITDPSISAEFPDILDVRNFVGMIRALGFKFVNEISFGADVIAYKYKDLFDNFKGKYHITTNCPPIYDYVEKFQTHIIDSLVKIDSPMIATAKIMKEIHGDDCKIIAITPCIAQKREAKRFGFVDEVISFEELRQLFTKNKIYENSVEFSEFDMPLGAKGSLYPLSTGILNAADINYTDIDSKIITKDGAEHFTQFMNDFASISLIKHHLNIFYCHGCAMGPGSKNNKSYLRNHSLVVDYTKRRLNSAVDKQEWEKNLEKFSKLDFTRSFTTNDQRIPTPSQAKIKEVIDLLGKDQLYEVGCRSCGYNNCSDFVTDVAKGLARPEMCQNFSKTNKQDYINKINIANANLEETKKNLEELESKLQKEHKDVKGLAILTKAIMEKIPSAVIVVDDKLKILQSNQKFIELIGQEAKEIDEVVPGLIGADIKTLLPSQVHNFFSFVLNKDEAIDNKDVEIDDKLITLSIFPIEKGKTIGAVFKNLYQSEVRKEEVMYRINDVIEKNLGMVQQIGFLLGEGASETERMLNSIINSFEKEDKEEK